MTDKEEKKEEKDEFECVDEECTVKMSKKFKTPEEKIEDLKNAIKECGFIIEERKEEEKDGEIELRILE